VLGGFYFFWRIIGSGALCLYVRRGSIGDFFIKNMLKRFDSNFNILKYIS